MPVQLAARRKPLSASTAVGSIMTVRFAYVWPLALVDPELVLSEIVVVLENKFTVRAGESYALVLGLDVFA